MKYITEGLAEALYQRRINESECVDEAPDWSGFKVRYTYAGDSLSDYESTCIVKAKDEKEAVRIAAKKVTDDAARNFRIDGRIDSYKQYKKDFPHSGFKVFEDVDIDEGTYDGVPVVAVPHELSSQDWNSKKVSDRIKIYLDYFDDAVKSKKKMSKNEKDDNFRKLEKICLGIKSQEDYSNANALLNIAADNGFVYNKYVEKLVNDLRTGKKFNLKGSVDSIEVVEDSRLEEAATYSIDKKKDNNFVIVNPEKGTRYTVTAKNASDAANKMRRHQRAGKCDPFDFDTPQPLTESSVRKVVEAVIDEGAKVIKSGTVKVKKAFIEKEFDEDDGWVEIKIKPGTYKYQVLDFRGWKPRQLEVNGNWVDVQGGCEELEELLNEEYSIGESIDEARWVTMSGRHVLVSDDGEIMAGGPGARKKFSSGAIKAAVVSANKKSKEA